MTHIEAIKGNAIGLEPTNCPGLLLSPELHEADGLDIIAVYQCDLCGWSVVIRHGCGDSWHAVNHYPCPAEMTRALAATLSYRKGPHR